MKIIKIQAASSWVGFYKGASQPVAGQYGSEDGRYVINHDFGSMWSIWDNKIERPVGPIGKLAKLKTWILQQYLDEG